MIAAGCASAKRPDVDFRHTWAFTCSPSVMIWVGAAAVTLPVITAATSHKTAASTVQDDR